MFSNAVEVTFGQTYTKSWEKDTDHLNYYIKFVVPSRGVVSITASKPYDSEGEYGELEFAVFDDNGEILWSNDTFRTKSNARSDYKKNVGLMPGIYYMTIKPGFRVTSGSISTVFSLNFEENEYTEVEDNGSATKATEMELGKIYTTYLGNDGISETDDWDYFKVNVEQNKIYRVVFTNFETITCYPTFFGLINSGEKVDIKYKAEDSVDKDGNHYYQFKATESGYVYIYFEDSGSQQRDIKFGVMEYDITQDAPPKVWGIRVDPNRTSVYITWNKVNASGYIKYEIQIARNWQFTWNCRSSVSSITSEIFSGLYRGIKYYVRVRAIKEIDGTKVYGPWSGTKSFKTRR